MADSSYAPESPDLTGYYSSEAPAAPAPPPQHQQYRGSVSHTNPFVAPAQTQTYLPPDSQHHQQHHSPPSPLPPYHQPLPQQQQYQPIPQQQQYHLQYQPQLQQQQYQPIPQQHYQPHGAPLPPSASQMPPRRTRKRANTDDDDGDGEWAPDNASSGGPGYGYQPPGGPLGAAGAGPALEGNGGEGGGMSLATQAAAAGIEVRTKFPVARIKRIMQADDDVGKVAQVTPVAVCEWISLLFFFPFLFLSCPHNACLPAGP